MADSLFRVNRGLTLNPQSASPSGPANGDIYYDSTINSFSFYNNGHWVNLASRSDVASATSLTSAQFTAAVSQASLVRVTGSTLSDIHGVTASSDGRNLIIYNATSVNIKLKHQSSTEGTAANRLVCFKADDVTLKPGATAILVYDSNQSRWVVLTTGSGSGDFTEFTIANNQTTPADVTDFLVDNNDLNAFVSDFSITRNHTTPPGYSSGIEDAAFYANVVGSGDNSSFTGGTGQTRSIGIQSTRKIVIGGDFTAFNGNTRNRMVRLNSDGTEDTAFYTNLGTGFGSTVNAILIQSDDKVLAGGNFTTFNSNTRNYLVRLNSDGTEDTAFYTNLGTGFDGPIGAGTGGKLGLFIQTDNKIVVGGSFTTFNGNTRNGIVRLNADGTEDTAFYTNVATNGDGTAFGATGSTDVHVQSDGKIIISGGFTAFGGATRNRLLRLNADGTEDTAFYTNLTSTGDNSAFNGQVYAIQTQSDGKIVVVGGNSTTALNGVTIGRVARLNSDGSIDATFATTVGTGFSGTPSGSTFTVVVQGDDKMLFGGQFDTFNSVSGKNKFLRLNADGTLDTTFDTNIGTSIDSASSQALPIALDPYDNSILVGGIFTSFNGNGRLRLFKLTGVPGTEVEYNQVATMYGAYSIKDAQWRLSNPIGAFDDAGLTFSITAGGQLQYTSTNITGTLNTSIMRFMIRGL